MSTQYRSPQGEVLEIPAGGGHALAALGWELLTPLEETDNKPPAKRGRPRKTE